MTRVSRKLGALASLWIFDPSEADAEVEALPCALDVQRTDDDRVMLTALGKKGRRWESKESVWLELTDDDALALVAQIIKAVRS
jgi:hypothetical protein